jgi:hypothetical protein
MRIVATPGNRVWLAKVASLVTILALVVAPACAPLCAAQTCTEGHASNEIGCHSHGAANGGGVYLQAVQGCSSPELQAANLSSADKRGSLQRVRAAALDGTMGVHSADCSSPSARNSAFIAAELESRPHFCFAISTVVLRI